MLEGTGERAHGSQCSGGLVGRSSRHRRQCGDDERRRRRDEARTAGVRRAGAQLAMLRPSGLDGIGDDELFETVAAVAQGGGLALVVQDAPQSTGVQMSPPAPRPPSSRRAQSRSGESHPAVEDRSTAWRVMSASVVSCPYPCFHPDRGGRCFHPRRMDPAWCGGHEPH